MQSIYSQNWSSVGPLAKFYWRLSGLDARKVVGKYRATSKPVPYIVWLHGYPKLVGKVPILHKCVV